MAAELEPSRATVAGRRDAPWLRVAGLFIPAALREDPEQYRRARTAVYLCAVPVLTSFGYAWNYWRVLSGGTALLVSGMILATNLAVLGALLLLRRTGKVAVAINLLLAYSVAEFTLLACLCGGPASSTSYWLALLPLVAMLTSGTRPGLVWLSICMAEYAVGFGLQVYGVEFPDCIPAGERMPFWVSTLSCLSLVCLLSVMIYERAKNGTLRTLLGANAELERARDAALAADSSKADFLAKVSNEIRTPLTAILGFVEILLRETAKGELPREHEPTLLTIRRNGEHLLEIINDILDLSKITAGRFDVERTRFSPMVLISDVVALMSLRAHAKGLRLSVECAEALPVEIENDERRLRQVLVNLLGNALKFTDAGDVVLRAVARTGARGPVLRFEIEDTGIGISAEQIERLFKPFAQADASTARRYGGTGLGLSICKRLVELLDGEIGVESRVGAGSLFWVELPLEPGDAKQADDD
jgi:signal transduction histidine kinase